MPFKKEKKEKRKVPTSLPLDAILKNIFVVCSVFNSAKQKTMHS